MNSEEIRKLIESNSNYWEKRALENKLNIIEKEEDYYKRISSIYAEANRQIDDKLAIVYTRYAKNNKLTLEEAYKKLPKAMEKQYKADVNAYIEKARAFNGSEKERQYLLNQSLMHQHSVLDQMRTEYREVVYNIDNENTAGKFLDKIYQNANYYAQFNNNKETFAKVDKARVQSLLEENWSGGGNFSQLIWKNKEQLVNALDDIVIKGLAVGDSYETMSKKLAQRMGVAESAAKRLIMTESARMDNQGLLDHYKETGVEQLVFVATLDNKTSEICRTLDGTIFNIEDAQIGLNVPPMHPYCRSVISPYYEFNKVEERIYKDKNGNTQKGRNRTYKEYLEEELNNKEQADAIVSNRNTTNILTRAVSTINYNQQAKNDISPITGYKTDDVYSDYVYRRNKSDEEYDKEKYKLTDEDVMKMFEEAKQLLEDETNEIAIRVKLDALEEILKSGKITNGFEIDKVHNFIEQRRIEAENDIFNIPKTASADKRPIYGYISNKDIENGMPGVKLAMYGDIKIILKNNVKNNSTFTLGDSLDRSSTILPSSLKDIKKISTYTCDLMDIKEQGLRGLYVYPEVQIFQKLRLKDVYEVIIPKELKDNASLVKLLKKKNITVVWE